MSGELNWITNFIWGIADDVLRDLYVRGKYRDVILPMTVLRRLDAVLEPAKAAVLEMKTPAASRPSSGARWPPMLPTPGSTKTRPGSATKSASPAISTSPGPWARAGKPEVRAAGLTAISDPARPQAHPS